MSYKRFYKINKHVVNNIIYYNIVFSICFLVFFVCTFMYDNIIVIVILNIDTILSIVKY